MRSAATGHNGADKKGVVATTLFFYTKNTLHPPGVNKAGCTEVPRSYATLSMP